MICVWLIETGIFSSAEESLDYFGHRRTDTNVSNKFQVCTVRLSFCLSVFLFFCISVFLYFCLSVFLSFCLSAFRSKCHQFHRTIFLLDVLCNLCKSIWKKRCLLSVRLFVSLSLCFIFVCVSFCLFV